MSILMKVLCIQAIIIGAFGGVLSFISSIKYIIDSEYVPCYQREMPHECWQIYCLIRTCFTRDLCPTLNNLCVCSLKARCPFTPWGIRKSDGVREGFLLFAYITWDHRVLQTQTSSQLECGNQSIFWTSWMCVRSPSISELQAVLERCRLTELQKLFTGREWVEML